MNATLKTILLTVLTLSVFALALVELSGVSRTALFNKFQGEEEHVHDHDTGKGRDKEKQAKLDEEVRNMPKTTLDVTETKFNFGTVMQGDKVSHTYIVKNTGPNPLRISNVQVSCGCTAPFFPEHAIPPGGQGEVTLEFDSAGKEGEVAKNALIVANAENAPYSIGFTAMVVKK